MVDGKINVILPCAGLGTRLGLPYPKETHMVAENTALIDLTFRMLKKYKSYIEAVTIIIAPEKGVLLQHLQKWSPEFHIRFCYFNHNYHEWAGSILSAEPDYGEKNVVLLPDSFLVEKQNMPLIPTFVEWLTYHSVVFASKAESNPAELENLGALAIDKNRVVGFCDKPSASHKDYNAFWCSFGFRKQDGRALLEMMTSSVQREPVDIVQVVPDAASFWVDNYIDLGVWPNLHELIQKEGWV